MHTFNEVMKTPNLARLMHGVFNCGSSFSSAASSAELGGDDFHELGRVWCVVQLTEANGADVHVM